MEIERKFLAKTIPEQYRGSVVGNIYQYYLTTDPEIRIRSVDSKQYFLTYKSDTSDSRVRKEQEIPISREDFMKLKDYAIARNPQELLMIHKLRSNLNVAEGTSATFDLYRRPQMDEVLIEIEFDTIDEANEFDPPEWFGEEVTDNKFYYNANLAKYAKI